MSRTRATMVSRGAAAVALLALACGGCATLDTLDGQVDYWHGSRTELARPYAGVRLAWNQLTYPNESFALVDLPFSLVLDTLVLPYTLYAQLRHGSLRLQSPDPPAPAQATSPR
jgi:uncharacterized protein YceK